jgi:hypothetical protein
LNAIFSERFLGRGCRFETALFCITVIMTERPTTTMTDAESREAF